MLRKLSRGTAYAYTQKGPTTHSYAGTLYLRFDKMWQSCIVPLALHLERGNEGIRRICGAECHTASRFERSREQGMAGDGFVLS